MDVVENDSLPAPFNLAQHCLSIPFLAIDYCTGTGTAKFHDTRRIFGRAVFWFMLGPVAVLGGWVLWIMSVLKAARVVWGTSKGKSTWGRLVRVVLAMLCCTVGAPVWLLLLWLKGGLSGIRGIMMRIRDSTRACCGRGSGRAPPAGGAGAAGARAGAGITSSTAAAVAVAAVDSRVLSSYGGATLADVDENVVITMLKDAPGGLGAEELQRYLDDPMSDPDVRRDEETRTTTVEHIKLLRNRLEATTKEQLDGLRAQLVESTDKIALRLEGSGGGGSGDGPGSGSEELKQIVDDRFGRLEQQLNTRSAALEARMGSLIDERFVALTKKLDAVLISKSSE